MYRRTFLKSVIGSLALAVFSPLSFITREDSTPSIKVSNLTEWSIPSDKMQYKFTFYDTKITYLEIRRLSNFYLQSDD